jgi:serine kinase of HPr protein (carbohydrate metabolism regulator)
MARKMTPYQASAIAINGRAILIEGPTGSGKSSLALALLDRGAQLVGDDSVMLEVSDQRLVAHPHPQTRGLLEVRNLGLIEYPVCDAAPVCLIVKIDEKAERFIDQPQVLKILGQPIPLLRLWPSASLLALKAELALQRFGIA